MAWCHQADSHYMRQCWPMWPFGITWPQWVNTLRLGQNDCHFAGNISKCIFPMKGFVIWSKFHWQLFVHMGPIDNNSTLVQVMAWCLFGTKPLSEPMLTKIVWHHTTSPGHNGMKTVIQYVSYKIWYDNSESEIIMMIVDGLRPIWHYGLRSI